MSIDSFLGPYLPALIADDEFDDGLQEVDLGGTGAPNSGEVRQAAEAGEWLAVDPDSQESGPTAYSAYEEDFLLHDGAAAAGGGNPSLEEEEEDPKPNRDIVCIRGWQGLAPDLIENRAKALDNLVLKCIAAGCSVSGRFSRDEVEERYFGKNAEYTLPHAEEQSSPIESKKRIARQQKVLREYIAGQKKQPARKGTDALLDEELMLRRLPSMVESFF